MKFTPSRLWLLSCRAYKKRLFPAAKFLKTLNFVIFHAIPPFQAHIEDDLILEHYGLGVVVHPNVQIGRRVRIFQNVTLAAETWVGSEHKIMIGDDVTIGAGAIIVGRGDRSLAIGNGATVGAGSVVTRDVEPGQTVVGSPARPLTKTDTRSGGTS